MATGQGKSQKRQGAKSNELYQLQGINRIVEAIKDQNNQVIVPAGAATEATLLAVLNAVVNADQDFEILLARDTGDSNVVIQQITDWSTGTPTVSYKKANGTAHTVIGPIEYLDPAAIQQTILTEMLEQGVSLDSVNTLLTTIDGVLDAVKLDTANLDVALSTVATEATLAALSAKLGSLGQKASAGSAPVVLSTEQEAILGDIKTAIDEINLDTEDLATETTLAALNALVTTLDTVLDNIKLDTAKLDVDLSTRASEVTLAAISAKLNSLGQKASAASAPVVLSTEQEAILSAIRTAIDEINLDTEGLALDATLVAIDAVLDNMYVELQEINARQNPATRTHNSGNVTTPGTIPAGSLRGSVLNIGNSDAQWNGATLPKGVGITWDAISLRDPYAAIAYDPGVSTLIIEYTT